MSEQLRDMIETYMIQSGRGGAVKLSIASGCSLRVIYLVKNEGHIPRPDTGYRIALACGRSEKDALRIAKECSDWAKETA